MHSIGSASKAAVSRLMPSQNRPNSAKGMDVSPNYSDIHSSDTISYHEDCGPLASLRSAARKINSGLKRLVRKKRVPQVAQTELKNKHIQRSNSSVSAPTSLADSIDSNAHEDFLTHKLRGASTARRKKILRHKNTTSFMHTLFTRDNVILGNDIINKITEKEIMILASSPKTDSVDLHSLIELRPKEANKFKIAFLQNPSTEPDDIECLLEDLPHDTRMDLLKDQRTTAFTITCILGDIYGDELHGRFVDINKKSAIIKAVLDNKNTDASDLMGLVDKEHPDRWRKIFEHRNADTSFVLPRLAEDASAEECKIIWNRVKNLGYDSWSTISELLKNKNCPMFIKNAIHTNDAEDKKRAGF